MKVNLAPIESTRMFRSKAWITAWLTAWGTHPDIVILNGSSPQDFIIYQIQEIKFKYFKMLTAYPAGVPSRHTSSIRSEYFQFDVDSKKKSQIILDYVSHLKGFKWDRFVIPDILVGCDDFNNIISAAHLNQLSTIKSTHEYVYGINLKDSSFEQYLKKIGQSARRKLFNGRKKIEQRGKVSITNIWPDRSRFFELLNNFHLARWGKSCYRDRNYHFMNDLLDELPKMGGNINFSVMSIDDVPVSVVFDICLEGHIYNLQSGYVENFGKGISLGILHYGYQIEEAFTRPNACYYDFMAGTGKKDNYKEAIATECAELTCLTLVRSRLLKTAYFLRGMIQKIKVAFFEVGVCELFAFCC